MRVLQNHHGIFFWMLFVLLVAGLANAAFERDILYEEDFEDLSASGWSTKTSSNWEIVTDNGSKAYHQKNTNIVGGNAFVNEWSIYNSREFDNMSYSFLARTAEHLGSNPQADFGLFFHYQDGNNYYYVSFNAQANETALILKKNGVETVLARCASPIITSTDYFSASVTTLDGEICVDVCDKTIFRFFDTNFLEGKIGLGTNDDTAYFDKIVVCEKPETDCVVSADFNNCSLSGWTAWDEDNWSLSNRDGSIILYLTSTTHTPPGNSQLGEIITLNNVDAAIFTFECDLVTLEGPSNTEADLGVVFCYHDDRNYYAALLNRASGQSAFVCVKNGAVKTLDTYSGALLDDDDWHHIKVEVTGPHYYKIYFDNVCVLEQWNGDLEGGKIGVGSMNDCGWFDNICITGNNIVHEEIAVSYPNGGEQFIAGNTETIRWLSEGVSNNVKLDYTTNNGSTWTLITTSVFNENQLSWQVPNVTASQCKVRVQDIDGSPIDVSDAAFSISGANPCSFTVQSPNGGESFVAGSSYDIMWSSTGSCGPVKIEYLCGGVWNIINANTANDGYYYWNVPNGSSCPQAKIKVTCLADANCYDESDGFFQIAPPANMQIVVTAPTRPVLWQAGSKHKISWTSACTNVKLEYSTNGGTSWSSVVNGTANTGCYDWTVPSVNSTNCLFRVCDAANPATFGNSCAFAVGTGAKPYLQVSDIAGRTGRVTAIIIVNGNTAAFDAFGLTLNYDPQHLSFVSVEKGALTANWMFFNGSGGMPGVVTIGGANPTPLPINSNGGIAQVNFDIICSNCGDCAQSHLTLSNPTDDARNLTTYAGTFSLGPACVLGDVNMDETITPGDALCAFTIFINNQTPTGECNTDCAMTSADANCDGSVTPGDALIIFEHYISGQPIVCATGMAKTAAATSVRLADVVGVPGQQVIVPVVLDNPAGLSAFGFKIDYPDALLEFKSVRRTAITQNWLELDGAVLEAGSLLLGGYHTEKIAANQPAPIAELVFEVKENAQGSGDITIQQAFDALEFADLQSGSVVAGAAPVVTAYELAQNYPNPFNLNTDIVFAVPEPAQVTIAIYNLAGKKVRTLVDARYDMGRHKISWDGKDETGMVVTSGVYLYQMTAGETRLAKKLMLLK